MSDATVCLGFDFDAVSIWLHSYDAADSPTKLSRGEYGAEVAVPRLLDRLDRLGVPATFFTPGHTVDSFPERVKEVHERGHDVQHHGWSHRHPGSFESRAAERADVVRGIESIEDAIGETPTGYRSPAWDFSPHTLDILRDLDFEWDSSQMGHDFRPYYLRTGRETPTDGAYDPGTETAILELPVSWHRDDWPALQYVPGASGRIESDEPGVFDAWREQFEWMREHVDGGVFSLTFHPQVVGQPPRLDYLEALVSDLREQSGVEFETFDRVAARF